MDLKDIIIQGIGLAGMTFNILSFQGKSARRILILQFIGAALFFTQFILLGTYTGALLNIVAALRSLFFFWQRDSKKWHVAVFWAVYIGCYVLTFTLFDLEPTLKNLLIEAMPTFAMLITTGGMYTGNPRTIRLIGYINSPLWLIYDSINFTLGGILCEVFSLISITVALIRYRQNKSEAQIKSTEEPNK